MPDQPQQSSQDGYLWVEIENFTPGIITKSDYANATGAPVPGSNPGQAQSAVGCIALPNGGLAPLPGFGTVIAPNHPPPSSGYASMIVGLFVFGPLNQEPGSAFLDNILYGQAELQRSGSHPWTFYLEEVNAEVIGEGFGAVISHQTLETLGPANDAGGFGSLQFNTMTGGLTIIGVTPQPCWALSYWFGGTGSNPNYPGQPWQWYYTDPSSPGSPPLAFNNSPTGSYPADVVTHQNRTVLMEFTATLWSTASGSNLYLINNEPINYSDPPGSLSGGFAQAELFDSEHPAGVGAWGSINASELFLVKNSGGAYFIEGDLNAPNVIALPGVTPTYGIKCRAAQTPIGFVYASRNHGLWAWSGGSTSQKVSEQLEDNFFMIPQESLGQGQGVFFGPTVDICSWGDWIITSNDWLYDTVTQGWWQLPPGSRTGPGSPPHLWYQTSWDGSCLYAAPATPTATCAIDVYELTAPTGTFTWTSYPLRLGSGSKNRQFAMREVVVRAQGNGTVEVILTGVNGGTSFATSSPSPSLVFISPNQPEVQRMTVGLSAQDITVTIISTQETSGEPAPIVYSVAIGYVELSQPTSAT